MDKDLHPAQHLSAYVNIIEMQGNNEDNGVPRRAKALTVIQNSHYS